MSAAEILKQIRDLSPVERRELVERVWSEFGSEVGNEDGALTAEQAAELDRRLDEFERDPNGGVAWEDVQAEARRRFGWK
jgi:putative addiction module component (TIGR02574 family)